MSTRKETFLSKFKLFCQNTHLHGLKYVVSQELNIYVRAFWAVVFLLHCFALVTIYVSFYKNYQENSVSFLTETTYLDWNVTFPAVTVCQISSGINLSLIEDSLDERDSAATLEFFLSDLLFFSGSCYSCQSPCHTCPKLNISNIVAKLRKPCSKVIVNCKWNKMNFDCCEEFLPVETEYGICFSINSLHTSSLTRSKLNFEMNRKTGLGELSLEIKEDVRVYFHAPEDVPFINFESSFRKDITLDETYEILFNVVEIENGDNIQAVSIEKRECRFPWEVPPDLKVHKSYSYSTCVVQCHAENQMRLCNCTHHLMPYYNKIKYCDINGLKCLTDNFEILNRLHARGSGKPGLTCECLPSCTEPEFNVVSDLRIFDRPSSGISIKMQSLPSTRLKRVLVKSSLDFVVSLGGAGGLYLGASLLTIVDILYIFVIKS